MPIPSVPKDWDELFKPPPREREKIEKKTNYIGVVYHTKRKQWRAFIGSRTIGWYDHPLLAAIDHDKEARKKGKPANV
jgi:hypothetical protein